MSTQNIPSSVWFQTLAGRPSVVIGGPSASQDLRTSELSALSFRMSEKNCARTIRDTLADRPPFTLTSNIENTKNCPRTVRDTLAYRPPFTFRFEVTRGAHLGTGW